MNEHMYLTQLEYLLLISSRHRSLWNVLTNKMAGLPHDAQASV